MKQRNLPFKSIPVDKLEKGWVDHEKPPIGHFMQRFDNVLFRDFEEVVMSRHKEQNFVLNAMDSEPSIKKKKKLKRTSTVDDSHEVVKYILKRENMLMKLHHSSSSPSSRLSGAKILDSLLQLRSVTLNVLEAILDWRESMPNHNPTDPAAFMWRGSNYVLKVVHDLDFLSGDKNVVKALGLDPQKMIMNPLMLPNTLEEMDLIVDPYDRAIMDSGEDTGSYFDDRLRLRDMERMLLVEIECSNEVRQLDVTPPGNVGYAWGSGSVQQEDSKSIAEGIQLAQNRYDGVDVYSQLLGSLKDEHQRMGEEDTKLLTWYLDAQNQLETLQESHGEKLISSSTTRLIIPSPTHSEAANGLFSSAKYVHIAPPQAQPTPLTALDSSLIPPVNVELKKLPRKSNGPQPSKTYNILEDRTKKRLPRKLAEVVRYRESEQRASQTPEPSVSPTVGVVPTGSAFAPQQAFGRDELKSAVRMSQPGGNDADDGISRFSEPTNAASYDSSFYSRWSLVVRPLAAEDVELCACIDMPPRRIQLAAAACLILLGKGLQVPTDITWQHFQAKMEAGTLVEDLNAILPSHVPEFKVRAMKSFMPLLRLDGAANKSTAAQASHKEVFDEVLGVRVDAEVEEAVDNVCKWVLQMVDKAEIFHRINREHLLVPKEQKPRSRSISPDGKGPPADAPPPFVPAGICQLSRATMVRKAVSPPGGSPSLKPLSSWSPPPKVKKIAKISIDLFAFHSEMVEGIFDHPIIVTLLSSERAYDVKERKYDPLVLLNSFAPDRFVVKAYDPVVSKEASVVINVREYTLFLYSLQERYPEAASHFKPGQMAWWADNISKILTIKMRPKQKFSVFVSKRLIEGAVARGLGLLLPDDKTADADEESNADAVTSTPLNEADATEVSTAAQSRASKRLKSKSIKKGSAKTPQVSQLPVKKGNKAIELEKAVAPVAAPVVAQAAQSSSSVAGSKLVQPKPTVPAAAPVVAAVSQVPQAVNEAPEMVQQSSPTTKSSAESVAATAEVLASSPARLVDKESIRVEVKSDTPSDHDDDVSLDGERILSTLGTPTLGLTPAPSPAPSPMVKAVSVKSGEQATPSVPPSRSAAAAPPISATPVSHQTAAAAALADISVEKGDAVPAPSVKSGAVEPVLKTISEPSAALQATISSSQAHGVAHTAATPSVHDQATKASASAASATSPEMKSVAPHRAEDIVSAAARETEHSPRSVLSNESVSKFLVDADDCAGTAGSLHKDSTLAALESSGESTIDLAAQLLQLTGHEAAPLEASEGGEAHHLQAVPSPHLQSTHHSTVGPKDIEEKDDEEDLDFDTKMLDLLRAATPSTAPSASKPIAASSLAESTVLVPTVSALASAPASTSVAIAGAADVAGPPVHTEKEKGEKKGDTIGADGSSSQRNQEHAALQDLEDYGKDDFDLSPVVAITGGKPQENLADTPQPVLGVVPREVAEASVIAPASVNATVSATAPSHAATVPLSPSPTELPSPELDYQLGLDPNEDDFYDDPDFDEYGQDDGFDKDEPDGGGEGENGGEERDTCSLQSDGSHHPNQAPEEVAPQVFAEGYDDGDGQEQQQFEEADYDYENDFDGPSYQSLPPKEASGSSGDNAGAEEKVRAESEAADDDGDDEYAIDFVDESQGRRVVSTGQVVVAAAAAAAAAAATEHMDSGAADYEYDGDHFDDASQPSLKGEALKGAVPSGRQEVSVGGDAYDEDFDGGSVHSNSREVPTGKVSSPAESNRVEPRGSDNDYDDDFDTGSQHAGLAEESKKIVGAANGGANEDHAAGMYSDEFELSSDGKLSAREKNDSDDAYDLDFDA